MILMKTRLYKAFEDLKLAAVILFLLVFVVCNSKCDSDEIVVYHKKPVIEAVYKEKGSIEVSSKPDLEPVIEPVKLGKKQPQILLIRECHPACISPSTCNSDTGRCQAVASDKKWSPKQEHSTVFFVNILRTGTFDPRYDEYNGPY